VANYSFNIQKRKFSFDFIAGREMPVEHICPKEPEEQFFLYMDFETAPFETDETISSYSIVAKTSDGTDASYVLLDQDSIELDNDKTELKVMVRAGTEDDGPYTVTFKVITSLNNSYFETIKVYVKSKAPRTETGIPDGAAGEDSYMKQLKTELKTIGTGGGGVANTCVYASGANEVKRAGTASQAAARVIGVIASAYEAADGKEVVVRGEIQSDDFSFSAQQKNLYVKSDGTLTETAPTAGSGEWLGYVGYTLGTDRAMIDPAPETVTQM